MTSTVDDRRAITPFSGQRVRYDTHVDFSLLEAALQAQLGSTTVQIINDISAVTASTEEFEERVGALEGPSGLMLFAKIDHTVWTESFGLKRRLTRWVLGNPLVAITMIRRDHEAGLFVPVELLIAERDDGKGSSVTYVLPSSLIAIGHDPDLRAAAKVLDGKFEAMVSAAFRSIDLQEMR